MLKLQNSSKRGSKLKLPQLSLELYCANMHSYLSFDNA